MIRDTRHYRFVAVYQSSCETKPEEPWTEVVRATGWPEAVKHASAVTDVLLLGVYLEDHEPLVLGPPGKGAEPCVTSSEPGLSGSGWIP